MNVFIMLAGVLIAACVFAAVVFDLVQLVRTRGRLRVAHGAALALTVLVVGCLEAAAPAAAMIAAVALGLAALAVLLWESGWNRLLPAFQLLFAAAVAAGMPFSG